MQRHNIDLARELRKNATYSEQRLWGWLRSRPLGCKFRRQSPIGSYIVDFACFSKRIVIEVDGRFHLDQESDLERDAWLRAAGWTVLRYQNDLVRKDLDSIRLDVEQYLRV